MTATLTVDGQDYTPVHNRLEWELGGKASNGERSLGKAKIYDDANVFDSGAGAIAVIKQFTLIEDATDTPTYLARGRIVAYTTGRDEGSNMGPQIVWDVSVEDQNIELLGLAFEPNVGGCDSEGYWRRPAETDVERVLACLADFLDGDPRASTVIADTWVFNGNTVDLDAKDYPPGSQPMDVIADCARESEKWFFVTIDHELFYDRRNSDRYNASLAVSDREDEIDGETVFAPIWDLGPAFDFQGQDIASGIVLSYAQDKAVAVSDAAIEAALDYWHVGINDPVPNKPGQAIRRANVQLGSRKLGHRTYQFSLQLRADQVDLLKVGQRIPIKAYATVDMDDATQSRRIAELKWQPVAGGEQYLAHIFAERPTRVGGNGTGGPISPKPPSPGTDTGAAFVDSNAVGADSPDMSVGIQPSEATLLMLAFATTDGTAAASGEYQDVNDPPTFVDASPQALTELEFVPTSDHDMTLLALDDPDVSTGVSSRVLFENPDGRHAAAVLLYRGATIAGLGDLQSGNGTSDAPSITVATSPGDLVVAALGYHYYDTLNGYANATNGPDQTHRESASKAGTHIARIMVAEKVATGALTTLSWALAASRQYSIVAVVLPGASTGDTTEPVGPPGSADPGTGGTYAPLGHVHELAFLSEDGAHYLDAVDIQYDPTASGLTATDVQEAIDALAAASPSFEHRIDPEYILPPRSNPTGSGQITKAPEARISVWATSTYDSFPDAVVAGRLIHMVHRRGTNHITTTDGVLIYSQLDPFTLEVVYSATIVNPSGDVRDPYIWRHQSGRLVVTYTESPVSAGTGRTLWTIYSDNFGLTWSTPTEITTHGFGTLPVVGHMGEFPDGTMFMGIYGKYGADTQYSSAIIFSTNRGESWDNPVTIANGQTDGRMYGEPVIRLLASGKLVALLRSDTTDHTYRSVSTDWGQTWSAVADVLVATGRPDFIEVWPGMLALWARNNGTDFESRYWTSWDEGLTWTAAAETDPGATQNQEYAAPVLLAPGYAVVFRGVEESSTDSDIYGEYYLDGDGMDVLGHFTSSSLTVGGVQIDPLGAASGDVLTFDGTKFVPAEPTGGGGSAGLIPVDTGTPSYTTSGDDIEVTVATVWGYDGTDGYYDAGGASAGEEVALYWDPDGAEYVLVEYHF